MRCPRFLSLYLVNFTGKRRVTKIPLELYVLDTCTSLMNDTSHISALSVGQFPLITSKTWRDDIGVTFRFLDSQKQGFALISSLLDVIMCVQNLRYDPDV